jgi:hypothetical protein
MQRRPDRRVSSLRNISLVRHSISSRILQETIEFMKDLETQGFIKRYGRQDVNKSRIGDLTQQLGENMELFKVILLRSISGCMLTEGNR